MMSSSSVVERPEPPQAADAAASLSFQADMLANAAAVKAEKGQRRSPPQQPTRRKFGSRLQHLRSRPNSSSSAPRGAGPGPNMDPVQWAEVRVSERDARICSLERELDASANTITELRSELVRLRATTRDERYQADERMQLMREENAAFAIKVVSLEERLLRVESAPTPAANKEDDEKARESGGGDRRGGGGRDDDDTSVSTTSTAISGDGDFREEKIDGGPAATVSSPLVPLARPARPAAAAATDDGASASTDQTQSQTQQQRGVSQSGAVTLDATYVAALRSQVDRCQKVIIRLDEQLGLQREYYSSAEKKLRDENAALKSAWKRQKEQLDLMSRQLETVRQEARSEAEDLAARLECKEATVKVMYERVLAGFERYDNEGVKVLRDEIKDLRKLLQSEASGEAHDQATENGRAQADEANNSTVEPGVGGFLGASAGEPDLGGELGTEKLRAELDHADQVFHGSKGGLGPSKYEIGDLDSGDDEDADFEEVFDVTGELNKIGQGMEGVEMEELERRLASDLM